MGQLARPLLKASGVGTLSSFPLLAGLVHLFSGSMYEATKGPMNQLAKNLACERAKYNIRVNSLAPWETTTSLVEHGKNLVELDIRGSNIVQLWEVGEGKVLNNLKFLRIGFSKLRTFDLRAASNLEQLTIDYCKDFRDLHIPSGHHSKLKYLTLQSSKLTNFHLGNTLNLKKLILRDGHLVKFQMPVESLKLEHLDLSHSKLANLHLGNTPNLNTLVLEGCNDLVKLQMPAESLKLEHLNLNDSKLKNLHLGNTPDLNILILHGCNDLVELQMPAESLNLEHLDLTNSKLTKLHLANTPNLKKLKLSHSKLKTIHLGSTQNLKTQILEGCNDLQEFQMLAESLKLEELDLSHSKLSTLDLGLTPNLKRLNLKNCYDLVEINAPAGYLKKLAFSDLSGCESFKYFLFNKQLDSYEVGLLSELHLITEPTLHCENDSPKFQFSCYLTEDPASSFGNLERLISIGLGATNLESFSRSICSLQGIKKLTLEGSITEAPPELDQLACLGELTFSSAEIKYLPNNICMLKHLKSLDIQSCWLLEKLPGDIGRLVSLEKLILTGCRLLQDIPNNICKMKHLKSFEIKSCRLLEKLPNDIGILESLETLILTGCRLSQEIPKSVCKMKCINSFDLHGCIRVAELPEEIESLEGLKEFNIEGTGITRLPDSICKLKHLKSFKIKSCCLLEKLPEDIRCLEGLKELNIEGTSITHLPQSIFQLNGLCIVGPSMQLLDTYGLLPTRRRTDDDDEIVCYI